MADTKKSKNNTPTVLTVMGLIIALLTFLFGSGILNPPPASGPVIIVIPSEKVYTPLSGNDTISELADYAMKIPADTEQSFSLSLNITDWSFGNDFYYEYQIPLTNDKAIINLKTGLSGTFSYSRELTEHEKQTWMHGGKLYDANGSEVGVEGNYPSFWSNPEGLFAVEFPKDLPHGRYTYELYQFIDGQYVSDTITFTV